MQSIFLEFLLPLLLVASKWTAKRKQQESYADDDAYSESSWTWKLTLYDSRQHMQCPRNLQKNERREEWFLGCLWKTMDWWLSNNSNDSNGHYYHNYGLAGAAAAAVAEGGINLTWIGMEVGVAQQPR